MIAAQPTVSVIIPTYNQRPDFLRATIRSVLHQPYANLEVVVSNNHSTNETESVLAEFSDPRLRIVMPETHLPMIPHFVFAGRQARGELISFLPSDDLVEPDWLESLLPPFLASPQAVFAFGEVAGVDFKDPDHVLYLCRESELPTKTYSVAEMLRLLIPLSRTAGWLVGDLIRTDIYHKVGGMDQPGLTYSGDHALAIRLIECGEAVYINKLVGRHRVWGVGEGKTEGLRVHGFIQDTLRLFQMLEESAPLRPYLKTLVTELNHSKKSKALILSLVLLEGAALHGFTAEQIKLARESVLKLDDSLRVKGILAVTASPYAPWLRHFHGIGKSIYRAALARTLNRQSFSRVVSKEAN